MKFGSTSLYFVNLLLMFSLGSISLMLLIASKEKYKYGYNAFDFDQTN